MSQPTAKPPKLITRCAIQDAEGHPCGAEIVKHYPMVVPTVGADNDDKSKALVQAVVGHLMKRHPQHAAFALSAMEQFLAFLTLGHVASEDTQISLFMARFSQFLCQVAAMPVTDPMLDELAAQMGYTMEDPQREKVLGALRYVRDFQVRKMTPPAIPG